MKKLLFLSLCFFNFQTDANLFSDIYKESASIKPSMMIKNIKKINELDQFLRDLGPRLNAIDFRIFEKFISQINSEDALNAEKGLNSLEKANSNFQTYCALGIVSLAAFPLIGYFVGATIGEKIGKQYDDQLSDQKNPHAYAEEYEGKGCAIGAASGLAASILFTAYITQIPNNLPA